MKYLNLHKICSTCICYGRAHIYKNCTHLKNYRGIARILKKEGWGWANKRDYITITGSPFTNTGNLSEMNKLLIIEVKSLKVEF